MNYNKTIKNSEPLQSEMVWGLAIDGMSEKNREKNHSKILKTKAVFFELFHLQ